MKPEDRKWLEEAMAQYTFNDTNKLKEIADKLKEHMTLHKETLID